MRSSVALTAKAAYCDFLMQAYLLYEWCSQKDFYLPVSNPKDNNDSAVSTNASLANAHMHIRNLVKPIAYGGGQDGAGRHSSKWHISGPMVRCVRL